MKHECTIQQWKSRNRRTTHRCLFHARPFCQTPDLPHLSPNERYKGTEPQSHGVEACLTEQRNKTICHFHFLRISNVRPQHEPCEPVQHLTLWNVKRLRVLGCNNVTNLLISPLMLFNNISHNAPGRQMCWEGLLQC